MHKEKGLLLGAVAPPSNDPSSQNMKDDFGKIRDGFNDVNKNGAGKKSENGQHSLPILKRVFPNKYLNRLRILIIR